MLLLLLFQNKLRRRGHPGDSRNVFRSGPALVLVRTAKMNRINRQTRSQIEEAGAFRSVKFVCGKTRGVESLQIARYFPKGLDEIAVQQDTTLSTGA